MNLLNVGKDYIKIPEAQCIVLYELPELVQFIDQ